MDATLILGTLFVASFLAGVVVFVVRRRRKVTIHAAPSSNDNYDQLLGRLRRDGTLPKEDGHRFAMGHVHRHGVYVDQGVMESLRRQTEETRREPDLVDGLIDVAGAVATHVVLDSIADALMPDSPSSSEGPSFDSTPDLPFEGGHGGASGGGGASGEW